MAWLRLHVGLSEDAKFRAVSRNAGVTVRDAIATFVCLLEDAANAEHRGIAARGIPFWALVLDFEESAISSIIQEFKNLKMVSDAEGGLAITNWSNRQFETDRHDGTNAERQRRFRERRRQGDENGGVTARNVTGNGRNVKPKRPETETETETDLARMRARAEARKTWDGDGAKLIARIGESAHNRDFGGCTFQPGPPVTVVVPTRGQRNRVTAYGQTLADIFGDGVLVTVAEAAE